MYFQSKNAPKKNNTSGQRIHCLKVTEPKKGMRHRCVYKRPDIGPDKKIQAQGQSSQRKNKGPVHTVHV